MKITNITALSLDNRNFVLTLTGTELKE